MFTPLGLFKDVPCPQGQECALLTCMFSHEITNPPAEVDKSAKSTQSEKEPTTTQESPPLKKQKLQATAEAGSAKKEDKPSSSLQNKTSDQKATPTKKASAKAQTTIQTPAKLKSISRGVSPPPSKAEPSTAKREASSSAKPEQRPPLRKAPRESLNPRMLAKAPVSHGVRLSILTKLHAAMSALNDKIAKDKENKDKSIALTPNELITMALDEEEKTAKGNASVYGNVIKLRIVKLSKMSKEDWVKEVKAYLNERYYKTAPNEADQKPTVLTTGLSIKEEIAIAGRLVTPLIGLEQYGYVTKPPTDEEIEGAMKGVIDSKGWEKCDRCGGRFQVFPGRREDGSLTTGGQCTYHPGKPFYPPKKRTDHITGHKEAYFTCCNETLGTSSGCTKGDTHVFKVSEAKRLASILQFEKTPAQPDKGPLPPVCFDCEMGYTTLGLELIRLTAVSWPEGKELLDVIVRPMGEILDLNSRFSGVFPEHYNNAAPHDGSVVPAISSASEDGEVKLTPLQVVESPAAARALLFQLLQPETPLIGHAIDNDLNVCRIIHPTVIDTVILYPVGAGLPNRMSLKTLSRKYLDRHIQTGGNRGHDSKEDAIATGDLVRVKAAESWKVLKTKGWIIQDGKLVPPPGATDDTGPIWRLGPGAGQKRTSSDLG
ncbi:RNA exonuclease 3 [Aspergillus bombycis]|uniref:RNA exonuclease 3 n=1 Tax=Aspergillus bombycis TaxID=109264 RepID=A0A1F7ZVD7_9EURO|nr:RNA exonuclease 3 [Aspergillus bombycis]OGM43377.1 RNA exonuclease 3 [Aspergillus bombycis]